MPRPVRIVVQREFRHDPKAAYAWLTDFEDADADRTEAVVEMRRVLERGRDRVVYEGETAVLGRRARSVTEVRLAPPDRWSARVVEGPRTGSFTEYHLTPTAGGCKLVVDYRFVLDKPVNMLALRVLKPLVRRELVRMWDGFEAAMAHELTT